MLGTRANIAHSRFKVHLRMHQLWKELILFITCTKDIVVAHTPSIDLICFVAKRIIVVTASIYSIDVF